MAGSWIYEDFTLQVETGPGGGLRSRLLASPYGPANVPFSLPLAPEELRNLCSQVERAVVRSGLARDGASRQLRPPDGIDLPPVDLQWLGGVLFDALFSGEVRDAFLKTLGRAEAGERRGVRLRLVCEPRPEGLIGLPWELLYRPDTRDFLGRHLETPIVRYLPVPKLVRELSPTAMLKVLVMISSPKDLPALDVQREVDRLRTLEGQTRRLELHILRRPTLTELRDALMGQPFDIFHFSGHGELDAKTGEGALLLQGASGSSEPLSGRAVGECLRDNPCLSLVVLNACRTAERRPQNGADPFSAVAATLLLAGLPATVAMQFPISDSAAIAFSRGLYTSLASSQAIETAVSEGRKAIYLANERSWEWVTPVLFLAAPEGQLLETRDETRAEEEKPAERSPAPGRVERPTNQSFGGGTAGDGGAAFGSHTQIGGDFIFGARKEGL